MGTSNCPCGVARPWARRNRRSFTRTVAGAIARGAVTLRKARVVFGVAGLIGGAS